MVVVCAGCARAPVSVVGKWQAYLGSGRAAKLYFGKPETTEIEFREDETYAIHLMWGDRSIAQTGGTYWVDGDKVYLSPWEDLDRNTWPGRAQLVLSSNGRSFTLPLPPKSRVREALFIKVRT